MNNAPNSVAEGMGQTEFPPKNDLLDGVRVLIIDDDKRAPQCADAVNQRSHDADRRNIQITAYLGKRWK